MGVKLKRVTRWVGAVLLLCAGMCSAQASDTERQIAEHNRKIQQYMRENKPDLALAESQALVALDPNNPEARANLGVMYFFKGDCAAAAPELHAATTQRAGLWRIQVLLGICERKQGDAARARADLESAFPHLEEDKIRMEAGMELIDLAMSRGDLAQAASLVETLRAHSPTDARVLYMAYRIHTELAGESMLSLAMADPDSAEMHQAMAHETLRYGDPAGAIVQFRKAIAINTKLPEVHFELAEVLNESTDQAVKRQAEDEYQLALKFDSREEKAECRLGEFAAGRGDVQAASEHYQRAIALAPSDTDAALGLAKALAALKQPDKALALLQQVVERDPTDDVAHFRLSALYRQMGKPEDSRRELELYRKYKEIKDRLKETYRRLRMEPGHEEGNNGDAR
jgi:Tfp pilus assembly protein PilF